MHSSRYAKLITELMNQVMTHESMSIQSAVLLCAETIEAGGVIHVFGTGHSALAVADTFYRAGGLACVNAILEEPVSLYAGGLVGSWAERQSGLARLILDRYDLKRGEPIIIFSVSGVNTVPVEVAREARTRGLPVVAVTSRSYSQAIAEERVLAGTLLTEADLVIDNHVPFGDAVLEIPGSEHRAAPVSTIAASFVYNLILEQITQRLGERGITPPIFVSGNVPGSQNHNAKLIARYRSRIRHF